MTEKLSLKDGLSTEVDFFGGGLAWGFSGSSDGNMSLHYGDTAGSLNNRKEFLSRMQIDPSSLVCAKQIHSDRIEKVGAGHKGRGAFSFESSLEGTDGFITNENGVALSVLTADCLPVFLYDPVNRAIGLLHAGWRSTKLGICSKAVSMMEDDFGTDPSKLKAAFGPCLKSCCYEVQADFEQLFPERLEKRGEAFYFDLPEENRQQLLGSGVREENIFDLMLCTFCSTEGLFSYRRQGKGCPRMMSVSMLKA